MTEKNDIWSIRTRNKTVVISIVLWNKSYMEDILVTHDLWQDPYLHPDPFVTFLFWILHLTDVKLVFNSEVKQEAIHEKNLMDYNSGSSVWQIFEIILMWRLFKIFIWFLQERIVIAQAKRELFRKKLKWKNWIFHITEFEVFGRDISLKG